MTDAIWAPAWVERQRQIESLNEKRRHPTALGRLVEKARQYRSSRGRDKALPGGVYILAYHGIVSDRPRRWETLYRKGSVTAACFQSHLQALKNQAEFVALEKVPALFSSGLPDRPYFAVTFDDGYSNLLSAALPATRDLDIRPTVFLNGAFAGGEVYYRVLAAMLATPAMAEYLRAELARSCPGVAWSNDPLGLFNQTKDQYQPFKLEAAIDRVFRDQIGDPRDLMVHLTVDDVKSLSSAGWSFADHTYNHVPLKFLDADGIAMQCNRNRDFWSANGIPLLDWLAYPNGKSSDVGQATDDYLESNPQIQGVFCNGGMNLVAARKSWLRLCPGEWPPVLLLDKMRQAAELSASLVCEELVG